jgi:nucleotide-binding universal stress UspA family protein
VALASALAAGPMLLRGGLSSLRLALPLALLASMSSIAGALLGLALPASVIQTALGMIVLGIVTLMLFSKKSEFPHVAQPDRLSSALGIHGVFVDGASGQAINWHRWLFIIGFGIGRANAGVSMGAPPAAGTSVWCVRSTLLHGVLNRGAGYDRRAQWLDAGARIGARLLHVPGFRKMVITCRCLPAFVPCSGWGGARQIEAALPVCGLGRAFGMPALREFCGLVFGGTTPVNFQHRTAQGYLQHSAHGRLLNLGTRVPSGDGISLLAGCRCRLGPDGHVRGATCLRGHLRHGCRGFGACRVRRLDGRALAVSQLFTRLLLATEGSEFDTGAEKMAFALALRCQLPLSTVVPLVSNPEYEALAPQLAARAEQDAAQKIAKLREQAQAAQVTINLRVRRGEEPYLEIVEEAKSQNSEMLIIRRRGKRGLLANLLVGEMVSKVVAHAPCHVLIVPEANMWRSGVVAVDPPKTAPHRRHRNGARGGHCTWSVVVAEGFGARRIPRHQQREGVAKCALGKPH